MKLLNLGCGDKYHEDWINIDFISNSPFVKKFNLLNGIPMKDKSIDVVYHSHVLEHFSKNDGYSFILECHRALKANGVIRIAVPDLEGIIREYIKNLDRAKSNDKDAQSNYNWIMLELYDQSVRTKSGGNMLTYLRDPNLPNQDYVYSRLGSEAKKIREKHGLMHQNSATKFKINSFFKNKMIRIKKLVINAVINTEQKKALQVGAFRSNGEIHQWMYDSYSLSHLLRKVGFEQIKVCSAFESRILNWEKYELDTVDGEIRKPDSIFIEATKI